MKEFRVTKRAVNHSAGSFTETVKARSYQITDNGCLVFFDEGNFKTLTIAPGRWLEVR